MVWFLDFTLLLLALWPFASHMDGFLRQSRTAIPLLDPGRAFR